MLAIQACQRGTEEVKLINSIQKETKLCAGVAETYRKKKLQSVKCEEGKKNHACLAVAPQTAKVTARRFGKNIAYLGVTNSPWFQASPGGCWVISPVEKGGMTVLSFSFNDCRGEMYLSLHCRWHCGQCWRRGWPAIWLRKENRKQAHSHYSFSLRQAGLCRLERWIFLSILCFPSRSHELG